MADSCARCRGIDRSRSVGRGSRIRIPDDRVAEPLRAGRENAEELLGVRGLDDRRGGPCGSGFRNFTALGDEGYHASRIFADNLPYELEPIHSGDPDIEEHNIRTLAQGKLKSLRTTSRDPRHN